MKHVPGGMKKRSAAGGALVGLGLAVTSAGFLAAAPSASAAGPDFHCPDHTTTYKVEQGTHTTTINGVKVTVTVSGKDISFTDENGDPISATYCLKAGTDNTGKQTGTSGDTADIPNNGGQTPDISYAVVYSVSVPSEEPSEDPTDPYPTDEPTETVPTETVPTETVPTETVPTATDPTVLPTESSLPPDDTETEPTDDSEPTTDPTVLPTSSTAPPEGEESEDTDGGTTPTVLGSESTAPIAVPTAVDAGLTAEEGQGFPGSLLIALGAAMALLGLGVGFVPVAARGKHTR